MLFSAPVPPAARRQEDQQATTTASEKVLRAIVPFCLGSAPVSTGCVDNEVALGKGEDGERRARRHELWPEAEDVRGITTNPSSASGGTS